MTTAIETMLVTIRPARPDEGGVILALEHEAHAAPVRNIDWSDIGDNWLLAEWDGGIVGCVCVCFGKPITYLDMLYVAVGLPHRIKATVVKQLLTTACLAVRLAGGQAVAGMVGDQAVRGYHRVLTRRGSVLWYHGTTYLRRA